MAENSNIGWTDHTQNFWWGCHKVSSECQRCYIDGIMRRGGYEPFNGPMRTKNWHVPFAWNRNAHHGICIECGEWDKFGSPDCDCGAFGAGGETRRPRVFTCSMSDFFHPGADAWRDEAWEVIRQCPNLDWLILTKRPELMAERLPEDWGNGWPHVWLGVTAGTQQTAVERIPILVRTPAAVRFVSCEPLLEPLDLRFNLAGCPSTPMTALSSSAIEMLDWVITGCERAKKGERRLMDLDWVRDIDRQCRAAGVPHFSKQYYVNDQGLPVEDGMLDGEHRQEFPQPEAVRHG